MGPRTAVLLLLLLLHLAQAHRTHGNRHLSREVRPRRHDSEERASGRRWTTSRNSPYQKIVSSYEQEVPGGQDNEPEDEDQAKAKSHKRKQWRTGAPSHDQITSETSSAGESEKAEHDHEFRSESSDHSEPVSEAPRKSSVPARRRVTTSHPQETSSDDHLEISTTNPKRRRRPPSTSTTTTTSSPQTMSDKLYNHFQPLDQNVPQDDIIPFLDFGRKLSPVLPTPSGANSIESKSTVSKLRSRSHHEDKESNSSDEEMLQEDMDVTVVKKAIERNSVPRTKLRVREQGISDYYRKRAPTQVRTTENLISTSDSSTASSISGSKNTVVLKKGIRHQAHHDQLVKAQERGSSDISLHQPTNVEILPEKRAELLTRPIERTAALVEESHNSPLTAESSLVKTVIKEVPTTKRSTELVVTTEGETKNQSTSTAPTTTAEYVESSSLSPSTIGDKLTIKTNRTPTNNTQEKTNPKILSTAVVTSVSVEGSDQEDETTSVLESSDNVKNKTSIKDSRRDYLNTTATPESNSSISVLPVQNAFISRNLSNSFQNNSLKNSTSVEPKNTPLRNDTSLRSRDIYRPKAIPSSLNIHHLPRQILFNITRKPIVPSSTPLIVLNSTDKQDTITTSPKTFPATESSTNSAKSTTVAQTSTPTATLKSSNLSPIVPVGGTLPHEMPQQTTKTDNAMSEDGLDKRISNSTSIATPKQYSLAESKDKYNTTRVNETQPSIVAEADQPLISVETESIPPPNYDEPVENLTFVPAAPEEDSEDQFPIYFTTLPASSVPVVDTRPRQTTGTEAAVVRDHRNMTTTKAGVGGGTDWVKVGAVDKEVEVVYPETLGVGAYLLAGLGVVPIILGALVGARFILAHNRKKVLDESEYSSEYNRSPLGTSTASPLPTKLPRIPTHVGWSETEKSAPPIAPLTSPVPGAVRWEFPREKLRLQTLLGQGNFGQVWKAEADDISGHEGLTRLVAVKTVKESANTREREDLLRELGIMQELGSHPNVVTLLGCCTEKEPIYLIMEYVMYGKLLSFLRDYRTRAHYYNFSDASDALTSRDLTVFAYCVARGMDYLSNKSIIHRDLAARNVLVDHNKLCKIADFGMSRNVRDTGQIYEQRQSKGALPIRWMAPESLHFSLFTHKTDVWSFGILMWEIVTLGSTPYSTMGAREVMRRVRDGYRLDRPSHCRHELFRVIAQCWHSEPSRRPTFAELKAELAQLLSDKELNGGYVDLESYADEMRRDSLHRHH